MKNLTVTLFLSLLIASCVQNEKPVPTADAIQSVENGLTTALQIDGDSTWTVEERMEHYGIPGMSIAVIHNGEIAWTKGYGVMNRESNEPVTSKTLFQASALSIPVTAYGVLRMVENEVVDLDENINNYLQSWQLPDNEFTAESKATIRNLLNHSAGVNLHATPMYSQDSLRPNLIEVLDGTYPAKNEPIAINKEPDESFYISYTGYGIIQQMMLDVADRPFSEQMDELVLEPLGMANSTYNSSLSPEQGDKAATAYKEDGTMVQGKWYIHPIPASRGIWTTAEDLAKFLVHLQQTLKGNRSEGLSQEMTELMVTPHSVSSYGPGAEYGLGMQLFKRQEEQYMRHWGWNTGYYSEMIAHREKEYGVVVMTNTTFPEFNAEVIRAVAQTYAWEHFVPVHKRVALDLSLADQLIGIYADEDRRVEVFLENGLVYLKNLENEQVQELVPIADSLFVRRNSRRFLQFQADPETETMQLLSLDRNDRSVVVRMGRVGE